MTEAYERLRELTRLQRELLAAGDLEHAVLVGRAWHALASSLSDAPPADALALLAETHALVQANEAALAAGLEHVERGRRALASYART
ncbi:MAG TPA: hypothetical protein VFB25_08895 [Gaiellaceae bacterium]|nr:hypothetical protein [Gaiellaceae bacterium]